MQEIFYIAVLIMSVVIHEIAHGLRAALSFGDQTAKYEGRLTLKPHKTPRFIRFDYIAVIVLVNTHHFCWLANQYLYNPNNFFVQKTEERGIFGLLFGRILANLSIAVFFE